MCVGGVAVSFVGIAVVPHHTELVLAPAAHGLIWEDWGDIYTVYQCSSDETHVFNHSTALILMAVEGGSARLDNIVEIATEAMGIESTKIAVAAAADILRAVERLDELGLIQLRNEAARDS